MFQSLQSLAKEVRITLESLKCLTYDSTKEQYDALDTLHTGLKQLMSSFRDSLPQREGLLVRPEVTNRATAIYKKRKSKQISKLIRRASAGRKRMPSSFRRIGSKANKQKKAYYQVGVVVKSPIDCNEVIIVESEVFISQDIFQA